MTGLVEFSGVAEIEMIKEVDDMLWKWAEWVDRGESNGLGYKMSSLNSCMAEASTLHPGTVSRVGVDGQIEELMSLVDVLLCRRVKPESKAIIDRYYRGAIGGEIAVASMVRSRSDSRVGRYAAESGVNRKTIQRWVHNAQVEFQLAFESVRTGVRQVGVFGVVARLSRDCAANDC